MPPGGRLDFIQLFALDARSLECRLPAARKALAPDGMLWICWPKGTSGVETDLGRDVIRNVVLAAGLVDVKVCVVDETFSGLKFVYRLKDR